MSEANLFLLIARHDSAPTRVQELGSDVAEALRVYEKCERDNAGDPDVEVVLLGSESLETLKRTHSSYFGAGARIGDMLAGSRE